MKKIFLSISFLLLLVSVFAQPRVIRSSAANTVYDNRLGAIYNFFPPTYDDTTQANLPVNIGLDSIGAIIFTTDIMSLWMRSGTPSKHWVQVGRNVSFQNSSSILFSGTGDVTDPVTANVNVSVQQGNALQSTGQGLFVKNFIQDGIKQPGVITWVNNYNYDVSPAVGVIGGVEYTSDWTPITLANADPTYNRFDLVVFNQGGTISVITGTPSDDPQLPPVADPSTQLAMAHIEVTANTTEPPIPPDQNWIYENYLLNSWTTTSSNARINVQSTNNPYSVPTDIEGTLSQNGDFANFEAPVDPTMSDYNVLTFLILSKALWLNTSSLILRFYNNGIAVGLPVYLSNSSYGFYSGQTSSYQIVSILLSDFGQLTSVDAFRITVNTTGANYLGFYIDNIQLQQAIIPNTGNFWAQGGNRWQTTGIIGTLDNNPINIISNNTLHTTIKQDGNTWMRAVNPGISFNSGTFGGSDNWIRRVGTGTHINGPVVKLKVGGLEGYHLEASATRGHEWYDMASSPVKLMQLLPSGELYLGTSFTDAGDYRFQLTGGARIDATSKAITLVGLSTDNTATQVAAKDASGNTVWRDASSIGGGGTVVTADNGLTINPTATNVQLGGTLLQATSITSGGNTLTITGSASPSLSISNAQAGGGGITVSTVGRGIDVTATNSNAIQGVSNSSTAIVGFTTATGTYGMAANGSFSSTNTVANLLLLQRQTSGTAANGIGTGIALANQTTTQITTSNGIISKWTDATNATRTSQFIITGVNSAVTADLLTLNGDGSIKFNDYGTGANTGTAAYTLQVDASGNIIEGAVGGGATTIYTGNSSLASDRTVSTAGFTTIWTGSNDNETSFSVTNTGTTSASAISGTASGTTSVGVRGISTSYLGVYGSSTSNNGVQGESTSGSGVIGVSSTGVAFGGQINPIATNTIANAMYLRRTTSSGAGANGIGVAISFELETASSGTSQGAGTLSYNWTDATNETRTSQVIISGVNSTANNDILTLNGNGSVRLNDYGTGGITGTAAFALAVDATGNIIEIALGGGGGGTVNSVAGTLNRITSTGGTDPIIDISASYVGQASIVTTGTLTTGGTGAGFTLALGTSTLTGDLPFANLTQGSALSVLGVAGNATADNASIAAGSDHNILRRNGTILAFGSIDLSQSGAVGSSILSDDNGGTGQSTYTIGDILWASASNTLSKLAMGTALQVLRVNAAGTALEYATIAAGGTLTNITGVNTNGFTWSIANPTTTPALTLGTSITGILKGNGTAISAAVAGTDYLTPTGSAALLTSFPTLNQNTTGSAATLTTSRNINGVAFNGSADITVTAAAGTLTGTTLNSTVVSSSLTSVSTITSGTWQGTAIGLGFGGTGLTSGGSANQILGMNAAGSASQYKTFSGANGIVITHGVGTVAISNSFNPTWQTLPDGATITWNVANGGNAQVTLSGTGRILSIPSPTAGHTYTIRIIQGSGGSKTITTWPTNTKWPTGVAPTLSTTAGKYDIVKLEYDGTNFYGTYQPDFN